MTAPWPDYARVEAPGYRCRVLPAARTSPLPGGLPAQGPQGRYRSMSRACRVLLPANRTGEFMRWLQRPPEPWIAFRDPFDGVERRARIADAGQPLATLSPAGSRGATDWAADITVEGPLELTGAGDPAQFPQLPLRADLSIRSGGRSVQHVMDSGAIMQRPLYSEGVTEREISVPLTSAQLVQLLRWTLAADTGEFVAGAPPPDGVNRLMRIAGGAAGVEYVQSSSRGQAAWEARMTLYGLDSAAA